MNHSNPDNPMVDAYLDGRLDERAREAFETRLASDPKLRTEIARQRLIDASLKRCFTPPAVPLSPAPASFDPPAAGETASESAEPLGRTWIRRLAVAALLILSLGGVWWAASQAFPGRPGRGLPPVGSLSDVYARGSHDASPVDVQYASLQDYSDALAMRFHQRLTIHPLPSDARILGLQFCRALSVCSVCIVVNVGDDRILLVADDRDRARPLTPADGDAVNIFTREFDRMVLHELTPRDEPCLLGMFAVPESP